ASVFARDTGGGASTAGITLKDEHLDADGPFSGKGWGQGPAPAGLQFPRCTTAPPESPHKPMNNDAVPAHFYRIEFRRLDGDELQAHWKDWYPWMLRSPRLVPTGEKQGPKLSESWPYPAAYDSVVAAPNNYLLLFEDGHVRLLEATVRPGETTPMHGHPYPAVLAFNATVPTAVTQKQLDLKSPLNGQGAGQGPAPSVMGMKVPTCTTMATQAPRAIHNASVTPLHYYRIEFKRIDGEEFRTNWQKWYPWMRYMKYMR